MGVTEKTTIQIMIQSIIETIDKKILSAKFDKSYMGEIVEIIDVVNCKYKVDIAGKNYTIYSATNMEFNVHEKVWIIAPNNNYNKMYISGKQR